jgi:hypothetical protein
MIALFLSVAVAHRAVETYERDYWGSDGVVVSECRRESRRSVSCLSTFRQGSRTVRVRDLVVRERSYLRVVPGSFAEEVVLE